MEKIYRFRVLPHIIRQLNVRKNKIGENEGEYYAIPRSQDGKYIEYLKTMGKYHNICDD